LNPPPRRAKRLDHVSQENLSMSLSSAKNYALRAAKSQDQKEATELLSKAIMELTLAIEAQDAKIKKMNKGA
jgi:hypothetical protein